MNKKYIDKKRLSVDVPIGIHNSIKLEAMRYNCSITKWILRAITEKIKRES